MSDTKREVYELATEKPIPAYVYRIKDFRDDPTISITEEAKRLALFPGVTCTSVEYSPDGGQCITATFYFGAGEPEIKRFGMEGWLVLRRGPDPVHPRDRNWAFGDSRVMFYSDAEFRERYEIGRDEI